jgi:hypothetical protein
MDPSKDKNYLYMKNLAIRNYHLDTFERVSDGKFVEDSQELKNIGEEIIHNFSKDKNLKINFFADICSAPGVYSEIILEEFPIITGIGISLPPDEGGVEFELDNKKFKKIYKNILDKKYKLELPKKLDLGIASCVSYQENKKNAFKLNTELILKSLYLLLDNLDEKGSLIINMTMKNINLVFNIINVLSKYFGNYTLWKSSTVWATKNTFYFFGYNYLDKVDIKPIINKLIEDIQYERNDIFKKFLGNNNEYQQINYKMNKIYQIRISAWKELIKK